MTEPVEVKVRDHIGAVFAAQDPVMPEELIPLVGRDTAEPMRTRTSVGSKSMVAISGVVLVAAIVLLPQVILSPNGARGLPPVDAEVSSPETGELVASMWEHIGAPGSFGNGWLYLYADGRLIWVRSDPNPSGGWIEQRLTPGGVEMVRSEMVRRFRSIGNDPSIQPDVDEKGPFDSDHPPLGSSNGFPRHIYGGTIQVQSGGRLIYLNYLVPDLFEHIADLWTWLPEEAWEQSEPKAYVPSRYAVCQHTDGYVEPASLAEHIPQLPPEAQQLLTDAPKLHMNEMAELDPAAFHRSQDPGQYCLDISARAAHTLVAALDEAGLQRLPHRPYDGDEIFYLLTTGADDPSEADLDEINIGIWPLLPHGVPGFIGA